MRKINIQVGNIAVHRVLPRIRRPDSYRKGAALKAKLAEFDFRVELKLVLTICFFDKNSVYCID
jgi:hypothetical protein